MPKPQIGVQFIHAWPGITIYIVNCSFLQEIACKVISTKVFHKLKVNNESTKLSYTLHRSLDIVFVSGTSASIPIDMLPLTARSQSWLRPWHVWHRWTKLHRWPVWNTLLSLPEILVKNKLQSFLPHWLAPKNRLILLRSWAWDLVTNARTFFTLDDKPSDCLLCMVIHFISGFVLVAFRVFSVSSSLWPCIKANDSETHRLLAKSWAGLKANVWKSADLLADCLSTFSCVWYVWRCCLLIWAPTQLYVQIKQYIWWANKYSLIWLVVHL